MKSDNTGTRNGVGDRTAACTSDEDEYYMDRMSEILDTFGSSSPPSYTSRVSSQLYLGNQTNADDEDLLSAVGVTHVLNMAGTRNFDPTRSPYKPSAGIKSFLMIQAEDYDEYDITRHFPDTNAFLDHARSSGGIAFVHCSIGVNRSGAVVAAYMMVSEHRSLLDVVADLKAKRSVVLTNVGFRRQLIRYARCRGLLDPVDRTQIGSSSSSDEKTTKNGGNDGGQLNGSGDDDSTSYRNEWSVGTYRPIDDVTKGYLRYDNGNNGTADSWQRSFQSTKASDSSFINGGSHNKRHLRSSASVEDLYSSVARRDRLLYDIDSAIGRNTYNDDENADSIDGDSTASIGGWTSSRNRYETGSISGSSSSSGSVVSGVGYERGRRSLELSTNGSVNRDNHATSRYEISSASRYATSTSGSVFDRTVSTSASSRIVRPTSGQSAGGSFRREPTANRYRTAPRSSEADDDVTKFLEEADRRAKLSSARRHVQDAASKRLTTSSRPDTSTGLSSLSSSRLVGTAARSSGAAGTAIIGDGYPSSTTTSSLGRRRLYGSERSLTSRLATTSSVLSEMTEQLNRFNF